MDTRNVITVLAVVVFLASGWGVWSQREELAKLRAELAQAPAILTHSPAGRPNAQQNVPVPVQTVSRELLRLRNRVGVLAARQRELGGVGAEADRLRRDLASSRTNAAAGIQLPPGYLRKADARRAGYATPEDTVQTFLWAMHQRDLPTLLETLTPEAARKVQDGIKQSGGSGEEMFNYAAGMPGLAIQVRETMPDGSVRLQVEIIPGLPKQLFTLRMIDGLWKLTPY